MLLLVKTSQKDINIPSKLLVKGANPWEFFRFKLTASSFFFFSFHALGGLISRALSYLVVACSVIQ